MGTLGAVMLFSLPPLAVYAVAYWFGLMFPSAKPIVEPPVFVRARSRPF